MKISAKHFGLAVAP